MQIKKLAVALMFGASLGMVGCTAEVEKEGEAPEVNVDPGRAPEIDVDPAQVEIGQDTQQVITPDVDVKATEGSDP